MIFVIDFDGTLSPDDTVDKLLERHADPAWEALENDWLSGRISALECMREQIALVRANRISLEKFFRGITIDPAFRDFWLYVREFAEVAIVSDGLDHAIQIALQGSALSGLPVFANRLNFIAPEKLSLDFPHRKNDCRGGNGVCKCAIASELAKTHGGPIILVGDGKSDACLAASADTVFAKGSLIKHCQQKGIQYTSFSDFSDVLNIVKTWALENAYAALA